MQRIGSNLERGRYDQVCRTVDEICDILRKSNRIYKAVSIRLSAGQDSTTWEELMKYSEKGHEFAYHTISHAHLSNLDKENILYELGNCKADIEDHLGYKYTLSVECPYGTHDERVINIGSQLFPFVRNSAPEDYIDEILRSNSRMPGNVSSLFWMTLFINKYYFMLYSIDHTPSSMIYTTTGHPLTLALKLQRKRTGALHGWFSPALL